MIRFLSLQRAKETAESNAMREWLSGGAPPCQGGGRGFDSRLALFYMLFKTSGGCLFLMLEALQIKNEVVHNYM